MSISKVDIINVIYEQTGLPKTESKEVLEKILAEIKYNLSEGDSIKISGFGTFNFRNKQARKGRNPKTGEEMEIRNRNVVTFKPSKHLMNKIDNGV